MDRFFIDYGSELCNVYYSIMTLSYIYTNSKKPLLMFIKSRTHVPLQVE